MKKYLVQWFDLEKRFSNWFDLVKNFDGLTASQIDENDLKIFLQKNDSYYRIPVEVLKDCLS